MKEPCLPCDEKDFLNENAMENLMLIDPELKLLPGEELLLGSELELPLGEELLLGPELELPLGEELLLGPELEISLEDELLITVPELGMLSEEDPYRLQQDRGGQTHLACEFCVSKGGR